MMTQTRVEFALEALREERTCIDDLIASLERYLDSGDTPAEPAPPVEKKATKKRAPIRPKAGAGGAKPLRMDDDDREVITNLVRKIAKEYPKDTVASVRGMGVAGWNEENADRQIEEKALCRAVKQHAGVPLSDVIANARDGK